MVDVDSFFHSLDNLGEKEVREKLALRAYGSDKANLAHEWLRRKEEDRIREATSRAEASASSANKAAWIAAIAAVVAAIAMIISIIVKTN